MRWSVPLALLALASLSGCLDGSLGFGPDKVGPEVGWPSLSDASLRPGARLYVPLTDSTSSQCTAGFLFQSADNATLYLSLAAHCLGNEGPRKGVGADVYAEDGRGGLRKVGDVAYDGWAQGRDLSRDFALVALRNVEGVRDEAHPAMEHWGGPTALADTAALLPGTSAVTYGASTQREDGSSDNVKQGRFVARDQVPDNPLFAPAGGSGQLLVRLDPPSQHGDSGSGLMLGDGRAAGILSLGGTFVVNGQPVEETRYSTFVPLDEMVEEARRQGGDLAGLRLVTWRLLETPPL